MIRSLLDQLDQPFTCEDLFDHLPDIVYFIKGRRGEYLIVNQTLVARCGLENKQQLIGRTADEVLRQPLGNRFAAQDQAILSTGQPLLSQLELHVYPSRDIGWCLTTKLPLLAKDGSIAGLVGVSQDLRLPDLQTDDYRHIAVAITHAEHNLSSPLRVDDLAALAEMSRYQLDRRMRRVFGLTTGQWLLKLRIDSAQRQLRSTTAPIAAIALHVGYADQSAFTRQFRQTVGLTPREYRHSSRH